MRADYFGVRFLFTALLFLSCLYAPGAQPSATARLYCLSLRFEKATTRLFGQNYTLELSTTSAENPANGELAPLFDPAAPSHGSNFRLQDPTFPDPNTGGFAFDVPPFADENGNGFADFFEVNQSIPSTATQGVFQDALEDGTVTATWRRDSGSDKGTCRLRLVGASFGLRPEFNHTFELLEYNGRLTYQAGSNQVLGLLDLQQAGNLSNTLTGAIQLTKVATNRLNQLAIAPGDFTNSSGQVFTYSEDLLERDQERKTNYFGFIVFQDGDPQTGDMDFRVWLLSIDDLNDQNTNSIPDLSDDPAQANPDLRPSLAVTLGGQSVVLDIHGQPGKLYNLQESVSLNPANWVTISAITLTNNSESLLVSPPANPMKFWRIQVP